MIEEAPTPTKTTAKDASEVRAIVKPLALEQDLPKFSVRYSHNPFGGDGLFFVKCPAPEGVSVITLDDSRKTGTRFGSSDGGAFAAKLQRLSDELRRLTKNVRVC